MTCSHQYDDTIPCSRCAEQRGEIKVTRLPARGHEPGQVMRARPDDPRLSDIARQQLAREQRLARRLASLGVAL